jgi:hypothetical protein
MSNNFYIKYGPKDGDALPPLTLNVTLDCVIKNIQEKQVGLKLNRTHQLLSHNFLG